MPLSFRHQQEPHHESIERYSIVQTVRATPRRGARGKKARPGEEQADGSPGEAGAISNPMPGLSPQRTPGIDRWSENDFEAVWRRATREL